MCLFSRSAQKRRFQRVWGLEVVGAGLGDKSAIAAERLTTKPARTKGSPLPTSQGLAD
ncbi:hypothetical protein IQ264_23035 [Phormidium sp. LEGE 05292]|uniref:hypothetical protein n=1 Tax=[Phormidium] sp. LEGE 05292 TaxID=767427 RepID=UPI0018801692|nr:hypothetical protein [Phormidium sp. LEGE 05292]MBE9228302.1 hypothetical protein [Phormidium sp. LEGE 05292]